MARETRRDGPEWVCSECGTHFSPARTGKEIPQVDDVTDAFTKHRERVRNLCPRCGGLLRLVKR